MAASGRVLQIWLGITLVASVLLGSVGLLDQLGYDLGLAVAILAAVAVPWLAAVRVAELRRFGSSRRRSALDYTIALYAQTTLGGALLLLVPLIVYLVRGIWVPHCDLAGGLLWYLLIPVISTAYVAAVSVFFSLATGRVVTALVWTYGFLLLTFVVAVRHLIADPPLFFFNGVVGYVPGPIYDEEIRVTATFVWARLGTLVWTALFVSLSASMCAMRRQRLDPFQFMELDYSFDSLSPRITVVVSAAAVVLLHVFRADLGTSPNARAIQAELGGRVESEHFVIYYDPDALTEDELTLLVDEHEFRLAQIVDYLGWDMATAPRGIESYVYPTREMKKRLMGAAGTSYADPFDRAMHLNQEPFPHPVLKHELAHIVSHDFAGMLGFNPRIGLHEGFAVAASWEDTRLTADQWSAIMRREGLLPDLGTITSGLRFWAAPKSQAYLSAGSFVRYLVAEYGPGPFQGFFRDHDHEKHFGRSFTELREGWETHLDSIAVSPLDRDYALTRLKRGAIHERRCPRQAAAVSREAWADYRLGRYPSALAGFDQLLVWAPEDANARLGKLYTLLKLDREREAIALGNALLSDPAAGVQVRDAAQETLADAAWRSENVEDARTRLAALADSGATAYRVRSAHAKLRVLSEPTWRHLMAGDVGASEAAAILGRLAASGPEIGLAHYLLGRRLYQEGTWDAAADHLARAEIEGLPDLSLTAECLRLLGIARYRIGDIAGADEAFAQLAALDRFAAEVLRAEAWGERCRWRSGGTVGSVSEAEAPAAADEGGAADASAASDGGAPEGVAEVEVEETGP